MNEHFEERSIFAFGWSGEYQKSIKGKTPEQRRAEIEAIREGVLVICSAGENRSRFVK